MMQQLCVQVKKRAEYPADWRATLSQTEAVEE